MSEKQPSRRPVALAWAATTTSVLAITFVLAAPFFVRGPWIRTFDDAFMFVRYADNLRTCGAIVWNPCEGHTYGLTSLGHFAVVAVLRLVTHLDPSAVLTIASLGAGLAWLASVAMHVARSPVRPWLALFSAATIAWAIAHMQWHFHSGMDTTLAMLVAWWWTSAAVGILEGGQTLRRAAFLGACGGLAWLVRPELAVVFGVVLTTLVAFPAPPGRRNALAALGALVLVVGACIGGAWIYFGTPFPLPFRAKALGAYEQFAADPKLAMWRETLVFFRGNIVLVGAAGASAFLGIRARRGTVALGVLAAAAVLGVFLIARMHAIMAFEQRFFMPLFPMLLRVGLDAVEALAPRVTVPHRVRTAALLCAIVGIPVVSLSRCRYVVSAVWDRPGLAEMRVRALFDRYGQRTWPNLDRVAALPGDVVIATTEVGVPGVLAPDKRLVDMAGLNDPSYVGHFDPDQLFRDAPAVIYLPPRSYVGMNRALTEAPRFLAEYAWRPPVPGSRCGYAIHKTGHRASELLALFELQP